MSYFGYPLYPLTPATQNAEVNIVGNTTLGVGAATYNKAFLITGAGGYTITLPALDPVNFPTSSFSIYNNSSALCTVNVNGTGSDNMLLLGSTYTSVSILPGERFLVQNMLTSWVIALESASRTTTAPQFDGTIRTASTAFVQQALGSRSGYQSITALSTTLTNSSVGSYIRFAVTANATCILPDPASIPQGSSILLFNSISSVGSVTVTAANSGTVGYMGSGSSFVLAPGQQVEFLSSGTTAPGSWTGFNGAGASILAQAGYQKFPSGLFMQWGIGTSPSAGYVDITYPVAFPTACIHGQVSARSNSSAANAYTAQWDDGTNFLSKTAFRIDFRYNDAVSTGNFFWMALGY